MFDEHPMLTRSMKNELEKKKFLNQKEKRKLGDFYNNISIKKRKVASKKIYQDIVSDMDLFSDDDQYKLFNDCKIDCDSDSDDEIYSNKNKDGTVIDFNNKLLEKIIRSKLKKSIRKAIETTLKKRQIEKDKIKESFFENYKYFENDDFLQDDPD